MIYNKIESHVISRSDSWSFLSDIGWMVHNLQSMATLLFVGSYKVWMRIVTQWIVEGRNNPWINRIQTKSLTGMLSSSVKYCSLLVY